MTVHNQDSFGSTTTSPPSALSGINDFGEGLVSYQTRAVNVLEAADSHPDSALANIYAGMLWMFLERPEAAEKSTPYAQRAEQAGGLNRRERGLLALLKAWQQHDHRQVLTLGERLCGEYPQDLPLLKITQYHAFNAGNAALMLKLALAAESVNAHRAPVHSMIAFGYEQLHDIESAEAAAYRALAIDPDEPWAHHALAHVHLSRGTINEGLSILTRSSPSWDGLNSFMFTHNWWHVALFEITNGEVDAALRIYDERCWGVQPEYSQDQIGAVSLLARLEIAGMDVGDRWQQLLPFLESRRDDIIQPFLTLQYLYGLARAESKLADDLLALIRSQAVSAVVTQDQALWREVGIPAAEALVAHARGDYDCAAARLSSVRAGLWRVGGSHAQRDLFEQILLDARLRSGQWELARKTLEQRRQWEPDSPILQRRLAEVYGALRK
jgi:tetratricopeptide (TPR) repeat protein